jgi:hypothetical protein
MAILPRSPAGDIRCDYGALVVFLFNPEPTATASRREHLVELPSPFGSGLNELGLFSVRFTKLGE